jgi:hypothetical protein
VGDKQRGGNRKKCGLDYEVRRAQPRSEQRNGRI